MTFLLVVAVAGVLLVLPAATHRIGERLAPVEWAMLSTAALTAGAALLETALVLRALPAALDAAGIDAFAQACGRLLQPLLSGGTPGTIGAAAGAVALPAAAALATRRARRLRERVAGDLWLGATANVAGHDVVVLPVDRPVAVSFETPTPVIVVSRGLLERLAPDELDAVVEHEAAHLAHHHQRLLTITTMIAPLLGRLPGVAASIATIRLALERWADEAATAGSPRRRAALRHSLLQLLDTATTTTAAVASMADARTVAARVHALTVPPPPTAPALHALLYLPGLLAAAVAVPGLYQWGDQLRMVVAMAGRCIT